MWYLIAEISVYLVSGFLIGGVVGWLFRGAHCKRDLDDLHVYWTGRVKMMDRQDAQRRQDLERADKRAAELETTLHEKVAALQRVAAHLGKAESRVTDVATERDRLSRDLQRSVAHVRGIQAQLEDVGDTLATQEQELAAATTRAEEQQAYICELEPLADKLASATRRIAKLQRAVKAADEKARKEFEDRLQEKEAELAHVEGRLAELECEAAASSTNGHRDSNGNGNGDNGHCSSTEFNTKDDLKQIRGIGQVLEERLNELGIFSFEQIAEWTPDDVSRIAEQIDGSNGRIGRDKWVGQARRLARQRV
jgi:predicted flap endonuclease-1-like 5' DNA nuclease